MNIQEALDYIEKYTAHHGKDECYGHPEWEIRKMPDDDGRYPGMYEVRCNEPEKVGAGSEDIAWVSGFRQHNNVKWYDRKPDFKQAYLTAYQVMLLAQDLMVECGEDEEDEDE